MKYRQKPVVIEATQYRDEMRRTGALPPSVMICPTPIGDQPVISTPRGDMILRDGDWIVSNAYGQLDVICPLAFARRFDPVPESDPSLQPHQQRVVDEKRELDVKRTALHAFITNGSVVYRTLPEAERNRLMRQLAVMDEYSAILGDRIANFNLV